MSHHLDDSPEKELLPHKTLYTKENIGYLYLIITICFILRERRCKSSFGLCYEPEGFHY